MLSVVSRDPYCNKEACLRFSVYQAAQHNQPRQGIGQLEAARSPFLLLARESRARPLLRARRPAVAHGAPRWVRPSGPLLCASAPCPRPFRFALRNGATTSSAGCRQEVRYPLPAPPPLCALAPRSRLLPLCSPWQRDDFLGRVPGVSARCSSLQLQVSKATEQLSKLPLLGLDLKLILIPNFQYRSSSEIHILAGLNDIHDAWK